MNDDQWLDTVRERMQAIEQEYADCTEKLNRLSAELKQLSSHRAGLVRQTVALRELLTGEPQGLASWPTEQREPTGQDDDCPARLSW